MNWSEMLLGIGRNPQDLTFFNVSLRAIIVFLTALIAIRFGDKRFLSRRTAFDVIVGFVLASMLARAINGSAPFWPSLGASGIVIGLHRLMAMASRRWHKFGNVVKGRCDVVVRDGKILEEQMKRNDLSEHDLCEDLRLNGGIENARDVKVAYIERNGEISVIKNAI